MADLLLRLLKCPPKITSDSVSSSARTDTQLENQRMGPFSKTTPWATLGLSYHQIDHSQVPAHHLIVHH